MTARSCVRTPWSSGAHEVASGAPLIVDVELGPGRRPLRPLPGRLGSPERAGERREAGLPEHRHSRPRYGHRGTFTQVAGGLDRPTSVAFTGDAAYVVTLTGKVLKIDDVAPRHRRRLH